MKRKQQHAGHRGPGMLIRRISLLLLFFLLIRGAAALGVENAAAEYLSSAMERDGIAQRLLGLELGSLWGTDSVPVFSVLLRESSLLEIEAPEAPSSPSPNAENSEPAASTDLDLHLLPVLKPAASATPSPPISPGPTPLTPSAEGINLKNRTDYEINVAALLAEKLAIHLDLDTPQILIIHTHSSEAFMPDGNDIYEESDPSRTEDKNYNIIRVGDELANALENRGIPVIHDRELYDYPSYTGAYTRSMEAISNYLEIYPSIKIVIDLHRDAFMDAEGNIYKTVAEINGETCAQVMLVMGTNFSGLYHPNWQENLKLALNLQSAMNQKYPGLARPVTISQYRYNQHATTGSMILEVGCNGNTLQEALAAVRFFADAAGDVFLSLSE